MEESVRQQLQQRLKEEHACYVLVTCKEAEADGNMVVEMDWEGDPDLVQLLLHDAYDKIDEMGANQCSALAERLAQLDENERINEITKLVDASRPETDIW